MEKQNSSKTMLKVAILVIALVSQINTIASVIMASIAATFPDASPTAVQYVMQFGMIGAFPISLAVGFLSRKFRIKPMLLIGLVAIVIGGGIPIISHGSLLILYVCAAIVGAGQGFMAPLLGTLILHSFEGKTQNTMLGLNITFGTGGATLLLLLAGPLVKTGWVNVYYLYFLAIPVIIITLLFLPLGDKPKATVDNGEGKKAPVPVKGWIQCVIVVLTFIAYVAFPLNVAMFIGEMGFTEAQIGSYTSIAMSAVTVVGALIGVVFQPIIKVVKLYVGALACLFGLISYLPLIFVSGQNIAMVYLGAALSGIFFGVQLSGNGYVINRICKPEQFGPTFSIIMSVMTLGIIISPIVINTITNIWGGIGAKGAFITSAIIFGVVFVIQLIWGTYLTKTCPEPVEAEG